MKNFKITENKPVKFTAKKGERYSFCTCGYSDKMPLCDGAHRENAPGYGSYKFEADKDQTLWLCECVDADDKRLIKKAKPTAT
jgi:CDGSH-type Zn-finger protein